MTVNEKPDILERLTSARDLLTELLDEVYNEIQFWRAEAQMMKDEARERNTD